MSIFQGAYFQKTTTISHKIGINAVGKTLLCSTIQYVLSKSKPFQNKEHATGFCLPWKMQPFHVTSACKLPYAIASTNVPSVVVALVPTRRPLSSNRGTKLIYGPQSKSLLRRWSANTREEGRKMGVKFSFSPSFGLWRRRKKEKKKE